MLPTTWKDHHTAFILSWWYDGESGAEIVALPSEYAECYITCLLQNEVIQVWLRTHLQVIYLVDTLYFNYQKKVHMKVLLE